MFSKEFAKIALFNLVLAAGITILVHYLLARKRNKTLSISLLEREAQLGLHSPISAHTLNYNQSLSSETPADYKGEIAALQLLINLAGEEKLVEVTGVWNADTEYYVKELTGGQVSTTIYDVVQVHMPTHLPEIEANDLYQFITTKIVK